MKTETWQLARVFVRSFDGKELLVDGVATIKPGETLETVRYQQARKHGVKLGAVRLEIIE